MTFLRAMCCYFCVLFSVPAVSAESGEFCIHNNLYGVFSAIISYTSIGVTLEQDGKVVYPQSGQPEELGWGRTRCYAAARNQDFVIHESWYFGSWTSREKLSAQYLDGIDVYLEKAGRYDENYGINLYRNDSDQELPDASSWMSTLYRNSDTPLNQICIPGSHDVGTEQISILSAIDPHLDREVQNIFEQVGSVVGLPLKEVIKWWSVTQHMSTYDQLKAGVRYLDIRARYVNGELVTAHGLVGASLLSIVQDLKRFLSENPREVVLFYIQETHGMTQSQIDELFGLLKQYFPGQLAPNSLSPTTAIAEFQRNHYQLVVISKNWNRDAINWKASKVLSNRWHDKNSPFPLLHAMADDIRYRDVSRFHVSQMILTAQGEDMKKMLLAAPPNLREFNATLRYSSGLFSYVNNAARSSGRLGNIVLLDFIEDSDLYATCMKENVRRLSL